MIDEYELETEVYNQDLNDGLVENENAIVVDVVQMLRKSGFSIVSDVIITRKIHHCISKGLDTNQVVEALGGGKTQINKTSLIMITMMICYHLRINYVVVAHYINNRVDLFQKLTKYTDKLRVFGWGDRHRIVESTSRQLKYDISMRHTIIVNDTTQSIQKVHQAHMSVRNDSNSHKHTVITYDECDTQLRTSNHSTMIEQSLDSYVNDVKPVLHFKISATLVPNILKLINPQHFDMHNAIFLAAGIDYIGSDDLEALKRNDGSSIFLAKESLTVKNGFYNKDVEIMVRDAASKPKSLTIIMVTSRQDTAESNNTTLAKKIHKKLGNVAVLVLSGKDKKFRLPNKKKWISTKHVESEINSVRSISNQRFLDMRRNVGDIIEYLDSVSLDMPIMIFCYRPYMRGLSLRSDKRVPSHLIVYGTCGLNIGEIVQAFGRGSGNQKNVLLANGFNKVTTLSSSVTSAPSKPTADSLMNSIRD